MTMHCTVLALLESLVHNVIKLYKSVLWDQNRMQFEQASKFMQERFVEFGPKFENVCRLYVFREAHIGACHLPVLDIHS